MAHTRQNSDRVALLEAVINVEAGLIKIRREQASHLARHESRLDEVRRLLQQAATILEHVFAESRPTATAAA